MKRKKRDLSLCSTEGLLAERSVLTILICFFIVLAIFGAVQKSVFPCIPAILGIIFVYCHLQATNKELARRDVSGSDRALAADRMKNIYKRLTPLIIALVVFVVIIVGAALKKENEKGYWGADGYYNPSDKEMEDVWDDVNKWMDKNW